MPGFNVTRTRTFTSRTRYDIAPRCNLRQPLGKPEYRKTVGSIACRERDQRPRHGAVAVGAKPHGGAGRLVRRRPGAPEQGLPCIPVVLIGVRDWPCSEG